MQPPPSTHSILCGQRNLARSHELGRTHALLCCNDERSFSLHPYHQMLKSMLVGRVDASYDKEKEGIRGLEVRYTLFCRCGTKSNRV